MSLKALVNKLNAKKVTDNSMKIGLTVSGLYTEKTDNTNRYDNDSEIDKKIKNLVQQSKNKRSIQDTPIEKEGG